MTPASASCARWRDTVLRGCPVAAASVRTATLQDEAALRRTLSLIIGRLEDFAKQVRQRMDAPDWSLQRDLIRLLVKRVEVDHDEINVVFRVAPPPASLPPGPEGGRSWQDCWRGDGAASGRLERGARRSRGMAIPTPRFDLRIS